MKNLITLLDGVTASGNGEWMEISHLQSQMSIQIKLGNSATVKLMASNAPNKPPDDEDGPQIGNDIAASGFAYLDHPYRWIKAKPTAVDGRLFVWLNGHRERVRSGIRTGGG